MASLTGNVVVNLVVNRFGLAGALFKVSWGGGLGWSGKRRRADFGCGDGRLVVGRVDQGCRAT